MKGTGPKEYVVYKEGMQIKLTNDINDDTICYQIFSVFCTLVFYSAIVFAVYL